MAQHRAATPGGPNIAFDGPAELATALLERLGALTTPQPSGLRRHASATVYVPTQLGRSGRQTIAAAAVTAVGAAAAVTATGTFPAVSAAPAALSLALFPAGSIGAMPAAQHAADAVVALPAPAAAPAVDQPTMQVGSIVDQAMSTAKDVNARLADAQAKAQAVADKTATAAKAAEARAAADAKAAAVAAAAAAAVAPVHVPKPVPPASVGPKATASGAAGVALAAAMSAMGKPYRWGATGPSAFDCSGLMQWAFARAGVRLPRTSAAQSGVGTAVSRSQLQPGDLVFFYSPVSHVGMYIGGGKVVNATQSGEPVQVSNIAYMPVHNIRRI